MSALERKTARTADGCLVWTGGRTGDGYGVAFAQDGKQVLAHRYALERKLGRELQPGELACHRCDNPPCVDEDHLFAGTQRDNMRDCANKGRWTPRRTGPIDPARGEDNSNARLTRKQVMDIRAQYAAGGVLQRELAAEFGISKTAINSVLSKKTWRE